MVLSAIKSGKHCLYYGLRLTSVLLLVLVYQLLLSGYCDNVGLFQNDSL